MKIILNLLMGVLLFIGGNNNSTAYAQENLTNYSVKFKITIINYYFGRIDKRTIVTNDSLSFEHKVYRGNSEKTSRLLNPDEKIKMAEFLEHFPLNQLDEQYVTNDVKDGTQMSFIININDELKEIFIGNVYQEDLGKLVKLIVPMLPEDFIQYKKELIYPY